MRRAGLLLLLVTFLSWAALAVSTSLGEAFWGGPKVYAETVHGETLGHGEAGQVQEEHATGVTREQLKNFLWWSVNFLILLAILYKFGKEPVANLFRSRKEAIVNEYEDLMAKKREAEARYAELQEKLKGLEAEAERLLAAFREQGEKEAQRIIEEAKANAERLKQQAELYIQQEMARAREELQREVAEMAVRMAEELIRKNITAEDHRRLFEEFLQKVEGERLH
ncbi:F0F1 ATP synthase subunit B [Thermosulfurimonas marina]|uniref:ATP synthase subunit b n=1 Tax=Thermosulfurimonas marina TaxID=2047767 RepID=A0A6H1WSE2_9BACT|nr:F0F1 ATP synthase subunit B [Thermosulfurimonas marina]QJA06102.1 F0F1 ATP synthase subunit B [Thermosulfurimonas marina]